MAHGGTETSAGLSSAVGSAAWHCVTVPILVYGAGINCASPNERAPRLEKIVEAAEIHGKTGLGSLHTSHCLPSGDLMVGCWLTSSSLLTAKLQCLMGTPASGCR